MIVDAFIYFNEADILDIRFEELYPVVDHFMIIESDTTFSGRAKPYYFWNEIESGRWDKYSDKINSNCFKMPNLQTSWDREAAQRNFIAEAIATHWTMDARDTVILSDADEIPRREVVEQLNGTQPVSLWLKKFSYAINVLTDERHGSVKVMPWAYLQQMGPHPVRKLDIKPYILDAGWEFSSLGGAEQVQHKLKSFSHTELDVDGISDIASIQNRIENLEDVAGRGYKHRVVEIDNTWPKAIWHNRQKWRAFEW